MRRRAAQPTHQRVAVLVTVFILHSVLIAFFLLRSAIEPRELEPTTTMTLIAIDNVRPAAAKPPPPTLPAKMAKTFKPIMEVSIPAEAEPDALAGASSACSTVGAVHDGLLRDPGTLVALRAAPPETRSIAGAVMMWNEGWIPAALSPDAPLWALRVNVEETLAEVPDACLDEEIIGPRLLPIPEADNTSTLFVVLGSGRWTWRQLLTPPPNILMPSVPVGQNPGERP